MFLVDGDTDTAHNLLNVALEGFKFMDVHLSQAQCLLHLGDISMQKGHLVEAARLWKEACPLFEQTSQRQAVIQINTKIATVEEKLNAYNTTLSMTPDVPEDLSIVRFGDTSMIEEVDEEGKDGKALFTPITAG